MSKWQTKLLKQLYVPINNLSYSRDFLTETPQRLAYIHYGDIHTDKIPEVVSGKTTLAFLLDSISIPSEEKYLLKEGDIVLVDASEDYEGVGKNIEISAIQNKKIVAGLHTIALRPIDATNLTPGFGRYLLKHPLVSKRLKDIAQGTKVFSISFTLIQKLKVPLPPLEEQQKIVEVLETWDKAIQLTRKLIEQKELQKKYLMQQLLTGRTRLKGFTDSWTEEPFRKLINIYQGYPFKSSSYVKNGTYRIITIANVQQGQLDTTKCNYINELPKNLQTYQRLQIGDLIFSMTGNVGRSCWVSRDNCLLNQRVGKIQTKKINNQFLYHFLQNPKFIYDMIVCAQGGAQANLSVKDILKYHIYFPSDITEQKSIAKILSLNDKEIDLLRQKLAKLEEQKKGLMQVLLTGKVRLAVKEIK